MTHKKKNSKKNKKNGSPKKTKFQTKNPSHKKDKTIWN
jgi:hypothetical protein